MTFWSESLIRRLEKIETLLSEIRTHTRDRRTLELAEEALRQLKGNDWRKETGR